MVIENTNFSDNGGKNIWRPVSAFSDFDATSLIYLDDSNLTMTGGRVSDNNNLFLVNMYNSTADVDGVDFTGNNSFAMNVHGTSSSPSTFSNCKFSAGSIFKEFNYDFQFNDEETGITFVD